MTDIQDAASAEALDSDFSADERIFHYTSSQGLYGILESNCLWATHFKFLNDSKEFYKARDILHKYVAHELSARLSNLKDAKQVSIEDGVAISDIATHEAEVIVNAMYTVTMNLVWFFVFSGYSCAPDDETFLHGRHLHWATYGRDGGYAIRLSPHRIKQQLDKYVKENQGYGYVSKKVVYAGETVPETLADEFAVVGEVARRMIEGIIKQSMEEADVARSASPFTSICSLLKDEYFRDENEARVVVSTMKDPKYGQPKIHIRHRGTTAIPYIRILEDALLAENNPIEAIIIGPHSNQERRREALSTYLTSKGLTNIEILESNVPYISD